MINLNQRFFSVSDVNKYIKTILSQDENLKYLPIRGEISNFKRGANGHLYFSLKDKDSLINVVMFANYANKVPFALENGMDVVVLASIDVYVGRGSYQLMAFEIEQIGRGNILLELEKLKKKLLEEGLFDESRKRPINIYPHSIGIITAKNSAAIKDLTTNIKRRYPICDIYVFYASVQGENAPKELLQAFNESQKYDLDTLIIGRGGGASEDLSAFNDETLVRALATSKMPIIAAVGHEIDSTLVDFVADKRASTPTGAAELATIDIREIEQHFDYAIMDMQKALTSRVDDMKDDLENALEKLNNSLNDKIEYLQNYLHNASNKLEALNPENILNRGYTLSLDKNGNVIKNLKDLNTGDMLLTITSQGTINSEIKNIEEKK